MTASLYDRDFYAWANEQAALLRAGKLDAADIAHIAEEIESMGRSEKRELVSRLTILLLQLLKWQFQPSRRGASWEASIANSRDDLVDHLEDNPSLKSRLPDAIEAAYRRARRDAAAETGLSASTFPVACPWPCERIMDVEFWPE
ncbi:protein of unknown function DUF29 [Azospirillum oryzae]|uniref:DUF29 domain-containing protein n=1 Tax=Azospirillum oryzae TaxID=286727 RepID=A0A1X7GL13_9PROT|nr:DUF29 domain-containing protein [Azospirillum oryzae]SMF71363.1 protein of unknown function DUF29 [Azospirillum oryzae]